MVKKRKKKSDKETKKSLVGLFFGSFNPIHLGHIGLAQFVFENSDLNELWYVVSPRNPLKQKDRLIDEKLRKQMIELAIDSHEWLHVSDIEFDMPQPSYTIDTLRRLAKTYPHKSFVLLIGSDNMHVFNLWKDYDQLLKEFEVRVYPRANYNIAEMTTHYPEMKIIENAPIFEISSTEIRDQIKNKQDASKWLHPAVYQFVIENNLYK